MYTHLLWSALDQWSDDATGNHLVDHALVCRAEMLTAHGGAVGRQGASAYDALAAEVAYDRALLKLCAVHGIEADPDGFSHPGEERFRLERELAGLGIVLMVPSRSGEAT